MPLSEPKNDYEISVRDAINLMDKWDRSPADESGDLATGALASAAIAQALVMERIAEQLAVMNAHLETLVEFASYKA